VILWRRQWWLGWFVGGWLAAAAAGISSGGYYRGHYFIQGLLPVCIAAAIGLSRLHRYAHASPIALLLVLALWAWPRPWCFGKSPELQSLERYHVPRFINARAVGNWLRARNADSLFVLGSEPEIYHESGTRGVSRYIIANPLFGGFTSSHARQVEVLEALRSDPPAYIVLTWPPETMPAFENSDRHLIDEVRKLLDHRYTLVAYTRPDSDELFTPQSRQWDPQSPLDLAVFARREP
jgi:hypothetical protein